ncbi:MAG: hypothetical protein CL896_02110 [Dehalococcoidia bacterium]|nr:hypothetical protein [Dehalococcoidia bacterium]
MAQQKLRVGLIGANGSPDRWGSRAHVPALMALDEIELIAVGTAHEDTARNAQRRTGSKLAFSDYRDLVSSSEVDAVAVSVRISLHHPIVMAALAAKKHVFCEWPLALNAVQATEMELAARDASVYHAVGTQSRFSPGLQYMRELIKDGFIGDPLFFNFQHHLGAMVAPPSHRWWQLRTDEGGGAILITTGHPLDVVRWMLGDVYAVSGTADTVLKEIEFTDTKEKQSVSAIDTICFAVQLDGGVLGVASASIVCKGWGGFRLEVNGTKGRLLAETSHMVQYSPSTIWSDVGGSMKQLQIPEHFTTVQTLEKESHAFHLAQAMRSFAGAIQEGSSFQPSFTEGLSLHKILEALNRSTESGRWEMIVK